MKRGSWVVLKHLPFKKSGIILEIVAGKGSFATWADVMWNDGSVETVDLQDLVIKNDIISHT